MSVTFPCRLLAALLALAGLSPAAALTPYSPVPVFSPPVAGPGLLPPSLVYGKEYSHDRDFSVFGPVGDPQQVIAWDGMGGTADTIDYSGTRPTWDDDQQVDAIANSRDSLFGELRRDAAHLIFSHDDVIATYDAAGGVGLTSVPSTGPITVSNGNVIGGAGEVSTELSGVFGPPSTQFTWAIDKEVNDMPLPIDVDGLEVWGPEPRGPGDDGLPVIGDADKYSLDVDFPSGVSVWNASGSPYVGFPTIVSAVTALLGPIPSSAFSLRDETQGREAINLDALMVSDIIEEPDFFNEDFGFPTGEPVFDQSGVPIEPFGHDGNERGDQLIFSIRQIVDPSDPDGYYATGSEIFVLDSLTGVSFLEHGGHTWDEAFALAELALTTPLPGDANSDGKVDLLDLDILGLNFGSSPATFADGDFNGDGIVDLLDLDILGSNFGLMGYAERGVIDINAIEAIGGQEFTDAPFSRATASSVPEPTAALLALLAIGAAATTRRG